MTVLLKHWPGFDTNAGAQFIQWRRLYVARARPQGGKTYRSPSPVLREVLTSLKELADILPDAADSKAIFFGHAGPPFAETFGLSVRQTGHQGLVQAEGVRAEIPDAIACDSRGDLPDSFATHVGLAVKASGGRSGEAKDVARRLLGYGEGSDVLSRYWEDDDRHLELARFSPL